MFLFPKRFKGDNLNSVNTEKNSVEEYVEQNGEEEEEEANEIKIPKLKGKIIKICFVY